jgi:hypothetical protein
MSDAALAKRLRLQRLVEALRRRDWLGLLFEIAVVTLGVLIAFEIEQWAQQRQRAEQERQFLERLYFEYGRAAEEMRTVIGHHDRVIRVHRQVFAARADPRRLQDYAARDSENMGCRAGYLGTAPFSDTVSQELISSGKLDWIRDPQLRAKIRNLTSTQEWLKDRADAGREVARDQNPFVIKYYHYEILPDGKTTCRILWPQLFADQAAVTGAIRIYRMHELVGAGRRDLLRETERVRKEIACKLGKPECRQ